MVVVDLAVEVVVGPVVHPNLVVVADDFVLVLVEGVAYSAYQTMAVVLSACQNPVYQQVVVVVPVYLNLDA